MITSPSGSLHDAGRRDPACFTSRWLHCTVSAIALSRPEPRRRRQELAGADNFPAQPRALPPSSPLQRKREPAQSTLPDCRHGVEGAALGPHSLQHGCQHRRSTDLPLGFGGGHSTPLARRRRRGGGDRRLGARWVADGSGLCCGRDRGASGSRDGGCARGRCCGSSDLCAGGPGTQGARPDKPYAAARVPGAAASARHRRHCSRHGFRRAAPTLHPFFTKKIIK